MISKRTHKKYTFKNKSKNIKRKKTKVLRLQKRWITGGDPTKLIKRQLLKNLTLLWFIFNKTGDFCINDIIHNYRHYYTYCMKKKGNLLDGDGRSETLPTVAELEKKYHEYYSYIKEDELKREVDEYMRNIDVLIREHDEQANTHLRTNLLTLKTEAPLPGGNLFRSDKLAEKIPSCIAYSTNHSRVGVGVGVGNVRVQSEGERNYSMLLQHIFEIGTTYIFLLQKHRQDNHMLKQKFTTLIEFFFSIDTNGNLVKKCDFAENWHGVMEDKQNLIEKYEKSIDSNIRSENLKLHGFIYYSGNEPSLKPMFEDKKADIMIDIQRLNQEINPPQP
jgi:hypothetical protein